MVQRYNILGRYTNQYLCLCSHAWSVEVSHGKIRVRLKIKCQQRSNTNIIMVISHSTLGNLGYIESGLNDAIYCVSYLYC